ncbi:efflux RND transporter periplasmic adaptor subunit [Candidatus Nitrospira nitrificans]|uniref:Putative Heavy metal efflux system, membrane fusion protein n=1 Tax=Candidatus Nitrospira nitrificans TaxID=1742973 RepID=A0A0S4LUX1_9BACT|nr:efflux RND transporter periplasmic adaptor subunit [Candidatus Nitrospira nitrificans]CUS39654.1 putative Heavy metal efflux system, membrane fusion protein [Candidatus Nitrospira nitrificans]
MQITQKPYRLIVLLTLVSLTHGCDAGSNDTPAETSQKSSTEEEALRTVSLDEKAMAERGITVEPVKRQPFRSHRDFPGTIELNRRKVANLTTLVRGRAIEVHVDLGQEVERGTLLATLESREFGDAQSAYLKAKSTLYVVTRAYERAQALLKEDIISVAEGQRREGDMVRAQAELRESYQHLRLMGMSGEQIKELARSRSIHPRIYITAPFQGFVIARNIAVGEVVEVTETMFVVADLSEVWVFANIPEKDISFILNSERTGGRQIGELHVHAYPDEVFRGTVTYVSAVLDVATRTMDLRLELPNPGLKLKPDMYATIRMYSSPTSNALTVPENAVQRDHERRFVFVRIDSGTFEARDVKLGDSNGTQVMVLNGLREGEPVVTNGGFTLKAELTGEEL